MKKLVIILCVVIMFFGIVGCPSPDGLVSKDTTSNISIKSSGDVQTTSDDSPSSVPEPITLVLLGSGLVSLSIIERKKFKK